MPLGPWESRTLLILPAGFYVWTTLWDNNQPEISLSRKDNSVSEESSQVSGLVSCVSEKDS